LSEAFKGLHEAVRDLKAPPDPRGLKKITPLIRATNLMVTRSLTLFTRLSESHFSSAPSSRSTLNCVSAAVSGAALAVSDLTEVLAATPLGGSEYPGVSPDETAIWKARSTEAEPAMAEHLANAAHQLDLCAINCLYAAAGIARHLRADPPEATRAASLSAHAHTTEQGPARETTPPAVPRLPPTPGPAASPRR
jgi:hypothetical protein